MATKPSKLRWVATHPYIVLGVIGLAVFGYWAYGTRQVPHHVRAVFAEAPDVYTGEDVQIDGLDAGKITSVQYVAGKAVLGVGIQDSQYWPLHQGTRVTLRFGTTVGNGTRYLQVNPGPASAPAIPQNGIIDESHTTESVEFDQVFNTFNAKTRKAFSDAMQGASNVVSGRANQIGAAIKQTSPALGSVSGFAADLSSDQQNLEGVVINGDEVTSALAGHQAQISQLVSNAAGTFDAFASNTTGIKESLQQLPSTLGQMKSTLGQLNTSLGHLGTFVDDVRPGATQLGSLSQQLLPAMTDLRRTIPVANATLTAGTKASPAVTALLKEAQPFSPAAAATLTSLGPIVACLRPYAPEIQGLLSTWASFTKNYDQYGHLARLEPDATGDSVTSLPLTDAQYVNTTGQGYALVRPPGYNAGDPQLDPSCGITADGLNPADGPNGADTSGESNDGPGNN